MTVLSSISSGIGEPLSRIDGPDKVSGRAKYAADHHAKDLAYGWIVSSAIAKGTIISIDETATRAVQGVVEVLTHKNRPHISWFNRSYRDEVAPPGGPFKPLYDNTVVFSFQPVALVVAETLEAARAGAALLQIHYETEQAETDFVACLSEAYVPAKKRIGIPMPANRGDAETAMQSVAHSVSSQYLMPPHRHNPMEPHATTVIFKDDGSLIVYDKTQGSQNIQSYLIRVFGLSKDKIIVRNPYVGGAFGSGLRPQNQVFLATMAALHLKRSVRVTMTRQQMVSHVHRPNAIQSVALGCDENGRLQAIVNKAITATSSYEDYMENVVNWALSAYQCENAIGEYKLVALDTPTPGDMRAPGAATGMNIFECAVDELASKVGIDPLEFRLINYTEVDAMSGKPFTSKELKRAYAAGAERFGWKGRPMEAGSKRDGHELIGWGMATGVWDAMFMKTSARARLSANGNLEIATAASDIGTGTYTILAQVASQTLGIPVEDISIKIGDSELPASPVEGGSWTAASSGAAVQLACQDVAEQLLKLATKLDNSPLTNAKVEDVQFCDHTLRLASDTSQALSIMDIFTKSQTNSLESEKTAGPALTEMLGITGKARNTHSAVFAEVKVDDELGVVRVTRVVVAVAAGRIINPKTARSQILGGVVMGIGMALHEETMMDHRLGRPMNHNFAEYHIPTNADVPDIDVIFVDEVDKEVSPLGVKGLGEIGIVGTAAAVANAVYHATGKRVREFPITLDKLISVTTATASAE